MENDPTQPPPPSAPETPPPVPPDVPQKNTEPPPVPPAESPPVSSVGTDLAKLATERNLAMFCHLSAIVGGLLFWVVAPFFGNIIGPLVIWLLKKDTMPMVNEHGRESLNFQITVSLAILACMALFWLILPVFLIPFIGLAALVLTIIGTVKASNGELYRYPVNLRLVK